MDGYYMAPVEAVEEEERGTVLVLHQGKMILVRADVADKDVAVSFEGYGVEFKELITRIKQLENRRFDGKTKKWILPLAKRDVQDFMRAFPRADIGPELTRYLAAQEERTAQEMELDQIKLRGDHGVTDYDFSPATPMAHQRASFEVLRRLTNGANFSEMGVGKTLSACHVAKYRMDHGLINNVLVAAPKSVMSVWADPETGELVKHGVARPSDIVILDGSIVGRIATVAGRTAKWWITNYEGTWRMLKLLKETRTPIPVFDMVILDESSRIKNKSAKQTKACIEIGKRAMYRMIMSGTPIDQSPLDMWSQCEFLEEGLLGFSNFYEFQNKYSQVVKTKLVGNVKIPIRRKWINLEDLQRRLEKFSVRYLKKDCLDLPPKVYTVREAALEGDQLEAYERIKNECLLMLSEDEKVTATNLLAQLTRLQQITSGHIRSDEEKLHMFESQAKLGLLKEVLEECQGQVVVWTRFIPDIAAISKLLEEMGISYVTFYGETKDRAETIKAFKDGTRVFVGQIDTGGLGIDLSNASNCVYFSSTFKWSSRIQSEDRLHRKGQRNPVTVVDLITTLGLGPRGGVRKTIDSRIMEVLSQKKDMAEIVNGDNVRQWLTDIGE